MFTVTLVTAQCGCGEQDVASSIDGRPVRVPVACKAGGPRRGRAAHLRHAHLHRALMAGVVTATPST